MSRVLTNNVGLQYAIEASIGVLPGSPQWRLLEPNNIEQLGATITTVPRRPISRDRGRKKGTVTDLESAPSWEADLTLDSFTDFIEGFCFSEFANVEFKFRSGSGVNPPIPTASGYTIDAASALLAGKVQWSAGGAQTLVYAKGYATAANNGLKVLTADLTATQTNVAVAGLVAEPSPPARADLQVAGVRTDDLTLTITGSTATLVSAADITWASLGVFAGMWIHIGSSTALGAVQNAYSTNTVYGYARVASVSGLTLNLDKLDVKLVGGPFGPATVDVLFGRFVRNVPVTANADDNRYIERSYQVESSYPGLGGVGVTEFGYEIGNFANELALNVPLTDKAGATWGFVGTNSDDLTATRKTNAANAVAPLRTTAINSSSDIASISTSLVSLASDVCFKSLTITLLNNVTPEKCLGTLGATFVNSGLFEVNLEAEMLFTNKQIINAIKNNTTVTFACILKNEDGAIAMDIPELTFGEGNRGFPVDASVTVSLTGATFTSTFGHDIGVTVFANVPTIRS